MHLARMYLGMGKYSVPMNPVAWDGYAHEREQVLDRMNIPGPALSQLLRIASCSHNSLAYQISHECNSLCFAKVLVAVLYVSKGACAFLPDLWEFVCNV